MQERSCFSPVFVLGVDFEDFRTGIGGPAGVKPPAGLAGHRVGDDLVRKWEIQLRIPTVDMLAVSSPRLREPIVKETSVSTAGEVFHGVNNAPTLFVLVETQVEEVVQKTGGLRNAERVDRLDLAGQRIRSAVVIR